MPSPSGSVRTVMTAPDLRSSFNRSPFHQGSRSPIENNIDPNLPSHLALLAPPGQVHSSYNSIARHLQDQPWNPGNLRSSGSSGGRSPLNQPNVQYGSYRGTPGPGSDMDSNIVASDSGYHSQPPQSIFSNEPCQSSQEVPSNMTFQVRNMNVESTPSDAPVMTRMQSDQVSQISSRSGKSGKTLYCPECGDISRCNSDLKCVYRSGF